MMRWVVAAWLIAVVFADIPAHLVTELPGFPAASTWRFKVYSGLLDVPGPFCGYDSLKIHYQFHTSQNDPSKDPLAVWHQGGPGASSIEFGLYGEMGAFHIGDKEHGNYLNPYAWNKLANMLYLESPAGSGVKVGYSQCIKDSKVVKCVWNDTNQAEAYAHTLMAFFAAYPEYTQSDFYLTGESYFGMYGPHIAHFILNNEPFKSKIHLKGIAAGNACWGGTETCMACNGPSEDKLLVDLYFGKGLFSPKLMAQIDKECDFPTDYSRSEDCGGAGVSQECRDRLDEMSRQIGPHNPFNIYDNCEQTEQFLSIVGKDMMWLTKELRRGWTEPKQVHKALLNMSGGYTWDCNGDVDSWITSPEVKKALHLDGGNGSDFDYNSTGPGSILLWPELAKKLRVLIYNGDADPSVPYNGNEDWVLSLEAQGLLKETSPWSPWYASNTAAPAGYITKYEGAPGLDFSFTTIRLAGHMTPTYEPEASFVMLKTFLHGKMDETEGTITA